MTAPERVRPGTAEQLARRIDWRLVPGFPRYRVSEYGQVVSLPLGPRGRPRLLVGRDNGRGYRTLTLCGLDGDRRDVYIHALVAELFIGPRPDGMDVRHLDGDNQNNAVSNLAYGSRSENIRDAVRHGTHTVAKRTHCKRNHPLSGDNLIYRKGYRACRTCVRQTQAAADRRHYLRRKGVAA